MHSLLERSGVDTFPLHQHPSTSMMELHYPDDHTPEIVGTFKKDSKPAMPPAMKSPLARQVWVPRSDTNARYKSTVAFISQQCHPLHRAASVLYARRDTDLYTD